MPRSQKPPKLTTARAIARNVGRAGAFLARHRVHQPGGLVGEHVLFADATEGVVYRESVVDRSPAAEPAVLVVGFRARGVQTDTADVRFRRESAVIIPFVVGHPGFVSKLWLDHDVNGLYRGLYEWDGPANAEDYVGVLERLMAPVIVPGSMDHRILPGLRRADVLHNAHSLPDEPHAWWRPVTADVTAG